MSWNPNSGQDPNQAGQYGGGYSPQQPNPNDPYSGQQYGQYGQQGAAPQPQYDPNSGQQYGQPGAAPQYDPNSGQQYGQPGGYQQPGYGQQQQQYGYQAPYGAQAGGAGASAGANATGPTSMGMQANVAAGLSYVLGWITGIIFFFTEKTNNFVRFNGIAVYPLLWRTEGVLDIVLRIGASVSPGFLSLAFSVCSVSLASSALLAGLS